jgi:hypothetical protein
MKQHEEKFDLARWKMLAQGVTLGKFIRKGERAQWRDVLTGEQIGAYAARFDEYLAATPLEDYRSEGPHGINAG